MGILELRPGEILFRGIHTVNLDSKGRLTIPTRYRERLLTDCDGQLVMTISTDDRCLSLFPLPEWEKLEQQLVALPSAKKRFRRLRRLLLAHACEGQMDGQGRLLVPPPLRKFAGLEKEVAMVGLGSKFELWDEESWNIHRNVWVEEESMDDIEELPPELRSLTF